LLLGSFKKLTLSDDIKRKGKFCFEKSKERGDIKIGEEKELNKHLYFAN
jgi:hypothetical protein